MCAEKRGGNVARRPSLDTIATKSDVARPETQMLAPPLPSSHRHVSVAFGEQRIVVGV